MFLPENVKFVLERLDKCGYKAYAVGGCVRDALLGQIPHDYDITTDAEPDETERCFCDKTVIKTGIKHGTVTVIVDGRPVEITTMRTDGEYSDSRHPDEVSFTGNIKEDLSRRDFTVNAMAYNDAVIDYFGGKEDLENGIIRAVGEAELRFSEDALRILRALRFSSKLGFSVEKNTAVAIHKLKHLLKAVSAERIFMEIKGIICGKNAENVLIEFADVICEIIPEFQNCIGFAQNNPHHIYDVYTHTVKALAATEANEELRLAALFHDIAKPICKTEDENRIFHFYGHPEKSAEMAEKILRRFKCDNKTRETVVMLIKYHDYRFPPTERNVKRLLAKIGFEAARLLVKLKRADLYAQAPQYRENESQIDMICDIINKLEAEATCISVKNLELNGNDLIDLGFEGKRIGEILNYLLALVIDGKIENEKNALLLKVRETEGLI